ncbi:MAG: pyruvate dehydrogenase (acetyl-transferring), homodimeric type [Pseudomonadota bacterium]
MNSPDHKAAVDSDAQETQEWLDALDSVIASGGNPRAQFIIDALQRRANDLGVESDPQRYSAYRNSVPVHDQPPYPGDAQMEARITGIMRWNAMCMVARANAAHPELGGHIATYTSAAEIFETGFHHFFRSPDCDDGGDLVFLQPHSSPGVYARAYLERRIDEATLLKFRQETGGGGLSSYPHPWLMPDFWQFPTGSMGIGPINAIYQARFMRYLHARGFGDMSQRRVWGIFGDGEMDEPESVAALSLAARERLGNLTFVINCNLQRLDGPVRGNGQIIQELESLFTGAGWQVLKVLWGSDWDPLFAADTQHALLRHFANTVDGQYQTLGANDGVYNQEHFFALDPSLQKLVAHMSAAEIDALRRGGHDPKKLFAALQRSTIDPDRPTVILAKTKKGYGMGASGESRMTAHQQKKLDVDSLLAFRDRLGLPLDDKQAAAMSFWRPDEDSAEYRYLSQRRVALGGFVPKRNVHPATLSVPPVEQHARFALRSADHEMSTTSALVRQFAKLLKDKTLGSRIVPIVADEARTFGMASLFRQIGIYSPDGQRYTSEDEGSLLAYRESKTGQLLEEGITEAGALSSWIAAATSYSTHNTLLLPFYIFYSIFGFQRVGDMIWAAADQRARGFLIGATAGRTTLSGEGLQHQDGSSHVMAAIVPNCRAYDPAFAYEVATIVDYGNRRMLEQSVDEFYYLTVSNENYPQPSMPENVSATSIVQGLYSYTTFGAAEKPDVRLMASGPILNEALRAASWLHTHTDCCIEVFSMTSPVELARNAADIARRNRLNPTMTPEISYVAQCLDGQVPVVAATDFVRSVVEPLAAHIDCDLTVLGTDGFGRSDTRENLRRFFEVDADNIAAAALASLQKTGRLTSDNAIALLQSLNLRASDAAPWQL